MNASPVELVVMVLERGIQDSHRAADAIRAQNIDAQYDAVNHLLSVLIELRDAVDPSYGSVSGNLVKLYGYAIEEVVKGNRKGDANSLLAVKGLLEILLDGFKDLLELEKVVRQGSPMGVKILEGCKPRPKPQWMRAEYRPRLGAKRRRKTSELQMRVELLSDSTDKN